MEIWQISCFFGVVTGLIFRISEKKWSDMRERREISKQKKFKKISTHLLTVLTIGVILQLEQGKRKEILQIP